jgi:hypothetical protein
MRMGGSSCLFVALCVCASSSRPYRPLLTNKTMASEFRLQKLHGLDKSCKGFRNLTSHTTASWPTVAPRTRVLGSWRKLSAATTTMGIRREIQALGSLA